MPQNKNDFILSIDAVSPKVGSELSGDAILAILYALGLILIYISIRFEFKYAVGAIAALTHDVLITLGIFSILGFEISLAVIAAFLTIVGYSLNDTIVVSDRIRENFRKIRNVPSADVINESLSQTLWRTINTSLTTFLVLLALFFFGGELIHNFSIALMIGVGIGTYSSMYVAASLMLALNIDRNDLIEVEEGELVDDLP